MMMNPKRSDRSIAVRVGVSQPTITRVRQRFLDEGIIRYEIVPNLEKLGFEIIAFSKVDQDTTTITSDNRVIYGLKGVDEALIMSVHKNYADYSNFVTQYSAKPVFLTVTSEILQDLSFRHIPF